MSATAAELLHRSTISEETVAGQPGIALHRTINLEERRPNGGDILARRRIEVWQSAAHGIKLRRIYDEQNALFAGEWTKTDGTASTVYRLGLKPQARTAPEAAAGAILETGELWRLDASARDFNALVKRADEVTVEEKSNTYILSYQSKSPGDRERLLHAALVLNKSDYHAIEQRLTVRLEGGEEREYRFVEAGFEQKALGTLSPNVFRPEAELLGPAGHEGDARKNPDSVDDAEHAALPGNQVGERVASAELEIEVTYLLNQIKANLGEQVSMTRTTGGTLRVEALVETEGRKAEILRALGPVINNPAVKVEVSTVAEAVKRTQPKPREATAVREVEVVNNRIPADPELRAFFSARIVGSEAIDEEINRYAARVMNRSRQALLRASALKRLVKRFSTEEMRALAPEAQSKWLAMIREHALGYQHEVTALRQELRSIFSGSGEAASATVSDENLAEAADRLLQLSYANDEAVRSAFTISADGRTAAAIKSGQFWRSLATAEKLAEAIQRLYRK